MRRKNWFNCVKYEICLKQRERASNLRSLSFAIERMRVPPASLVSMISKAGGGRGVAGAQKNVKNTSSSMQLHSVPRRL